MNSQVKAALITATAIILSAIISAIVALLIESQFNLIDIIKYKIIGKKKEEKTIVFPSKKELPLYKESIEKATSEICLLSIHAISLIRLHESLIEEKLKSGCQLKILSVKQYIKPNVCLLYTSPSPRDGLLSRMPSSA